jgi:Xaa-Pro aminopeptidase
MESELKVSRVIAISSGKLTRSCVAHESPYLNQGNLANLLKTGMTFTSEPGVYLIDKFGVRHEDVLLVQGDEEPVLLTGTRASGPWDP